MIRRCFWGAVLTMVALGTAATGPQGGDPAGRSSFLYADGKAIILDEDGSLSLARLSPTGIQVLSEVPLFATTSWTVPALVGTTLYARDREQIVALDLGR